IWGPSHFTKASACSSSAKLISTELRCFPTMPAAARHAWFFGNRSRGTSSPAWGDRRHVAGASMAPDPGRAGLGLRREPRRPPPTPLARHLGDEAKFPPPTGGRQRALNLGHAAPRP